MVSTYLPYLQGSVVVARTLTSFFRRYARGARRLTRLYADISAWVVTGDEAAASRRNTLHLYASAGSSFVTIRAKAFISSFAVLLKFIN